MVDYASMTEEQLEQAKNALDVRRMELKVQKAGTDDDELRAALDMRIREIRAEKLIIQQFQDEKFPHPPVPGEYTIGAESFDASS